MPAGVRVETGKESADRSSEEIRDNLSFLQTFLLVFGFIAVFVGSFLIFNTFSITVAQRVSEFGMLRTLGASRRQILSSVLVEAVGDRPDRRAARHRRRLRHRGPAQRAVQSLRSRPADDRPGPRVAHRDRLAPGRRRRHLPLLAGPGPALDPGAADRRHARLRPDPEPPPPRASSSPSRSCSRWSAWRCVLAGLLGSGGAGTRAGLIGGGALVTVIAVSLFSPRLVPALAPVAGWPLERVRRLIGRLARENAQRNPSRTAITAAALMIGLALVAFVTVFAAGIKSTVAQVVDENFAGGLIIQNTDGFSPIPNGAAVAASKVPGVETVATIRSAQAKDVEGGATVRISAPSPDIEKAVNLEWKEGGPEALQGLRDDQAVVSDDFASEHDLRVGDRFRILTQTGARPSLRSRRQLRLQGRRAWQRRRHPGGARPRRRARRRTRSTSSSPKPVPTRRRCRRC